MKKNVLYIGNYLKHPNSTPTYMFSLGKHLEQEGLNIKYASSKTNKIARLLYMLWYCLKYRNWLDIIFIDVYSTQNFYYALLVSQFCRLLRIPYITILHGGNLPSRLDNNPWLSSIIFRNSEVMVSPSMYLKEEFSNRGYSKLIFIPNSLDLKNYPFQERDFKQLNLLWVRSFSKIYEPTLAVKIAKDLEDLGYQVKLTMIGPEKDGSLKESKELAEILNSNVEFTGKLSQEEWIALSSSYEIFINTTKFDNMPVSVIEAMALGLLVISTNVGGLPYLVANNREGLLVPEGDQEAFVKAIISAIQNPVKSQGLARNARSFVEQFDWEIVKHQWFKLLY